MSFCADVVFPDEQYTSLLELPSNEHLFKSQFKDDISSLFAVGIRRRLNGVPSFTMDNGILHARCDHEDALPFWFELTSRQARGYPNGRLNNSIFPPVEMQQKRFLDFFGLCGIFRNMPLLEPYLYQPHNVFSKFSKFEHDVKPNTVAFERPCLPHVVFWPINSANPLHMFDRNGNCMFFEISNKPLRIEITFPQIEDVTNDVVKTMNNLKI